LQQFGLPVLKGVLQDFDDEASRIASAPGWQLSQL
jgi:hypothetical protein